MSQVSYGTITITDTNDIERIYTVYAKSAKNTVVPTAAASDWKELISEAPGTGNYIWQRTVVEKSGTGDKTYSSPVCLTGEEGTEGKGISSIIIKYGTSANWDTQPANWYDSTPEYSSATPNYWTQTTINYTTGNPTIKTTQDKALTQAIYDAVVANSIAQHANEDAQGALGQASSALQRVQAKYGTSATEATTAAKVANCDGFQLFKGAEIFIEFTHKNDVANPTLNVNSTGAKSIRDSDGNVLDSKFYWKDGSLVHFVYDGSYWRILDIVTTEKYNSLISDINGVSRAVGEKASQTDLTNLTERVSASETKITQTATSITSLVSNQDTYTAPDGTTKTNTIKSAIKQNAENISLRVEKNGVIAAINASTESSGGSAVKISADKVNIEGAAIFNSGRLSQTNLSNTIHANYGYKYSFDIVVYGESNKYYPIYLNNDMSDYGQVIPHEVLIERGYSEQAPSDWNTATHKGGLMLVIKWNYGGWGGATYRSEILAFSEQYSTMVGDVIVGNKSGMNSTVYLRGGGTTGALYHIHSDVKIDSTRYGTQFPYIGTTEPGTKYMESGSYYWSVDNPLTTPNTAHIYSLMSVKEEQYIYISKASGTTSVAANTTWVTETGNKQNTWTTKRPTYDSSYPVLFVAKQKKAVNESIYCTTPVKDDTTTIIDGGHITTGTIDASKVTVTNLQASSIVVGSSNVAAALDTKASNSAEYEVVVKVNSINYTTPSATLIAIPTKLGASTTGSFIWYKNAIGTAHGGTVSTTTNTNDTLTVADLNALYIAVLQ